MVNREPGTPGLETRPERDQERRMGAEQCPPEPDPARDVLQASPAPPAGGDQRGEGGRRCWGVDRQRGATGARPGRPPPPGPTEIRPHGPAAIEIQCLEVLHRV